MKKCLLLLIWASFALPVGALAFTNDCGNLDDPTSDPIDNVGDPINPQMGDVARTITDLQTFGPAPILFTRYYNSRTTNFNPPYWELGAEQTWQHNWNYEVRDLSSSTFGHPDVKVRYPNGKEDNFKCADTNGVLRVPSAKNGDRLYKWSGSPVGHTLITAVGWEYDFKRTTSPKYRLEAVRNGQGFSWTLTYGSTNRLLSVTNNFGRWIALDRETGTNGVVRISSVRSSDGRQINYSYSDWTGNSSTDSVLSVVAYPDGSQAQYTYVGAQTNTVGRALLASASDPMVRGAGARVKHNYNYDAIFDFGNGSYLVTGTFKEQRNLITDELMVSQPLGAGAEPEIVNGDGTEVGRRYENGLLVEKRDGEGRPTSFTYDQGGFGYIASVTDGESNATTYVRDYAGRVLQRVDRLGYTNSFTYSTNGFAVTLADKLGRTTTITRNTTNLPTRVDYPDGSFETWTYNQYGQALTRHLRNGGTGTFTYYGTGESCGSPGDLKTRTDPLGNTSTFTWTPAGLPSALTDARGNTRAFVYDWRGQLRSVTNADNTVVSFHYDAFGNRTNVTDELGRRTQFTYDEYNRLKTIQDSLSRVTTYDYGRTPGCTNCGPVSLVSRITDPAGKVTEFSYDGGGRLTNETSAAGTAEASTTAWTYDAAGRRKGQTDANGNVYTWVYDAASRVVAETNALGQVNTSTYDAIGNRLSRTDGAGIVTTWTYDSLNRVTATGSGTLSYEYGYDTGGRRTTMKTKVNNVITDTTTYSYNARDQLLTKIDPSGFTLSYGYDAVGSRTNLSIGSVLNQVYSYDNRNRVSSITGNGKTTMFIYDAAGRLAAQTLPNGATVTNVFDDANQLLNRVHKRSDASTVALFGYGYDLSGNRTNMTTVEGVNSYAYDEHNWLTSAGYPDGRVEEFEHDAVGNRTELDDNNLGVTAYTYGSGNRLLASTSATQTNAYSYDGAGRMTNQVVNGRPRAYAYSFRSQMTSLADTNGTSFSYEFDGSGNRTKASNGCLTSRFVYDGPNVVLDLNASNQVVHAYVNAPGTDRTIEQIDFAGGQARNRYVYHTDGLGSVVALTDNNQQMAKSYSYEAFGKIRVESLSLTMDRYTYTAREAIGDSLGFCYYRGRVYDPNTGRFTSEDPLGFVDGPNAYWYLRNVPNGGVDPFGLSPEDIKAAFDWIVRNHPEVAEGTYPVGFYEVPLPGDDWTGQYVGGGIILIDPNYTKMSDLAGTVAHELQHVQDGAWNTIRGRGRYHEGTGSILQKAEEIRRDYEQWDRWHEVISDMMEEEEWGASYGDDLPC